MKIILLFFFILIIIYLIKMKKKESFKNLNTNATLCNSFNYINNMDCVESGETKISQNELFTSFIYSCSVLSFNYTLNGKKHNFMAHVDTFNSNMENELNFEIENVYKKLNKSFSNIKFFKIYYGSLCIDKSCKSRNIIERVLKKYKIKKNKFKYHNLQDWNSDSVYSYK